MQGLLPVSMLGPVCRRRTAQLSDHEGWCIVQYLNDVCEDEVCPVSPSVTRICCGNRSWVLPHELAELLCHFELQIETRHELPAADCWLSALLGCKLRS